MGLSLSRPQNENALRYFIDEVASKYILSQNFNDLTNLNDDNYKFIVDDGDKNNVLFIFISFFS